MNDAEMMKQANQMWSMLDEMAENDPKGYKEFINTQRAKEKIESMPPIANMCIKARSKVDIEGSDIVYINVMSWARVPTPMSEDQAWSCACSDVYRENKRNLVTVAFHTTIMDKFDWRDPNKILPELLAPQVIQHLTKIKNMKMFKDFKVLEEPKCMGDINIATKNLLSKFGDSKLMKTMINKLADPFKDLDPNAVDLTVKVEHPLHNVSLPISKQDEKSTKIIELPMSKEIEANKKPEYMIIIKNHGIQIKINLPEITDKNLLKLCVSEDDFRLEAYGYKHLIAKLGVIIMKKTIFSIFKKKEGCLYIWADLDMDNLPEILQDGSMENAKFIDGKLKPLDAEDPVGYDVVAAFKQLNVK